MENKAIKNWRGKIIGWLGTDSNGIQYIFDFGHKILGKYDPRLDVTMDFYGRQVARGNQLSIFLKDED